MRQAQDRGLTLRLWGSLAIEYHSPSFRRLGLHETHVDVDFAGKASERNAALDIFGSLGFGEPDWRNRGSLGAGWVLLKNERQQQVEIAFVHTLDSSILERSAVTLPIEYLLWRSLVGVIEPGSTRVWDLAALLLDHPLVESARTEEEIRLERLRPLLPLYPKHVAYSLRSTRETIQQASLAGQDKGLVLGCLDILEHSLGALPELDLAWLFIAWGLLSLERMGPYEEAVRVRLQEQSIEA